MGEKTFALSSPQLSFSMKQRFLLALLAAGPLLLAAASGDIHSSLFVPVGQQFRLGGGQPGGFEVAGQNVGPVPVEVLEQPANGAARSWGQLAPGQRTRLRFGAGAAALVRNLGQREAHLELVVHKGLPDQNLTMKEEAVRQ